MFKAFFTAVAIAFTTSLFAQSRAATEAWVKNYVSNQVAAVSATLTQTQEAEKTTFSITENGTNLLVTVEKPTVAALVLNNCSAKFIDAGFTNGMTFAYVGDGVYKNSLSTIQASKTNLVFDADYPSREIDGVTCLVDRDGERHADVSLTHIQPSVARKL